MSATPERIAWLREQLAGRIAEEPVAGEIFRPRGAWGDRPARFRRLLFRLGAGEGLHELERGMAVLNLAVATPSRLHLFALRGARGGMSVGDELASWPLSGLAVKSERRTVEARHFAASGTATSHNSRIVVLRVQPPGEPPLEIDLAASRDAGALVKALRPVSRPSAGA